MKYLFYSLLTILLSCSIASCENSKNQVSKTKSFAESLTVEDTLAIEKLIDSYFTFVTMGKYDEAVGMLYRLNYNNDYPQPELLDNEQIAEMLVSIKALPVTDFNIEYIKINDPLETEVMVNVIMIKGQNGMPDIKTKQYFKPIFHLGSWLLTTMNSNEGDQPLVDAEEHRAMMLKKELSK